MSIEAAKALFFEGLDHLETNDLANAEQAF